MKEIRLGDNATSTSESRHIEGYAIVFNSLSNDLGGFREIIERGAITDELINNSDIVCLMNHDIKKGLLARSYHGRGSLKLDIDEHGLHYSFEAPKTALGDEVLEGIRRGDISKCSFAFVCGEDNWTKDENGEYIRHVKKIKNLYDVSLVYHPAYEETEVKADTRGLDELKAQEEANNIVKENSESDMNDKQELITQLQTILEKLKTEFLDWSDRIERLSAYMASTGKSYKNHLATIRNWARRDSKTPTADVKPKGQASYDISEFERQNMSKPIAYKKK